MKVPFRKLKYIHHISDIQIRNLKRHREYEEVFNRLYEEVKKNPKNAISYIGGDIAHSKTEMSPELVDQLSALAILKVNTIDASKIKVFKINLIKLTITNFQE